MSCKTHELVSLGIDMFVNYEKKKTFEISPHSLPPCVHTFRFLFQISQSPFQKKIERVSLVEQLSVFLGHYILYECNNLLDIVVTML